MKRHMTVSFLAGFLCLLLLPLFIPAQQDDDLGVDREKERVYREFMVKYSNQGLISAMSTGKSTAYRNGNSQNSAPDRLLVKFKQGRKFDDVYMEKNFKMKKMKFVPLTGLYVYKLDNPDDKDKLLNELKQQSNIEYAEPDYEIKLDGIPSDPSFSQLWGLHNT